MEVAMFCRATSAALLAVVLAFPAIHAQAPPAPLSFEVISIKRNTSGPGTGGGMRTLPDGTFMMRNQGIGTLVTAASPVPVLLRDVVGLPQWAMSEPYDV